jgi:hypothetical protein
VRAGCIGAITYSNADALVKFTGGNPPTSTASLPEDGSLKQCDVMDIDLQRWMNVTVSVNGRIMDVYLDGKLARSCILSNVQRLSEKDLQYLVLCPTFSGYVSGIRWSNYAVAPDVIYGRYQSGPYISTGFVDYLVDKLGIRIQYTTSADGKQTFMGGLFDTPA